MVPDQLDIQTQTNDIDVFVFTKMNLKWPQNQIQNEKLEHKILKDVFSWKAELHRKKDLLSPGMFPKSQSQEPGTPAASPHMGSRGSNTQATFAVFPSTG